MALVREYDYKDRHYTVTVNKDGERYHGLIDIEGVHLPAVERQVTASFEEGAFEYGRRRAEELIDGAGPASPLPRIT